MRITCPSCNLTGNLSTGAAVSRGTVTCPRCKHAFSLEITAADATLSGVTTSGEPPSEKIGAARMTCSKCGLEQEVSESCHRCEIVFRKYRPPEANRVVVVEEVTGSGLDARAIFRSIFWLLTNKQVGKMATLVVMLVVMVWWASASAQRRMLQHQANVSNEAELRKANEGPHPKVAPKQGPMTDEERQLLSELKAIADSARHDGDLCREECKVAFSKMQGASGTGKDAIQQFAYEDINSSVEQNVKRFDAIRRGKVFSWDRYYLGVCSLVKVVKRFNSLRCDQNYANFEDEFITCQSLYADALHDVETNDPKL